MYNLNHYHTSDANTVGTTIGTYRTKTEAKREMAIILNSLKSLRATMQKEKDGVWLNCATYAIRVWITKE